MKKRKRIHCQQSCSKIIANRSSQDREEKITRRKLGTSRMKEEQQKWKISGQRKQTIFFSY